MLNGRHSISRTSVRTRTAAFELSYIPAQGVGMYPAIEPTLTMVPCRHFAMYGTTARQMRNIETTFTSRTVLKWSGVLCIKGPVE